jgi:sortase A
MNEKCSLDELSIEELTELLHLKKRKQSRQRLKRMKDSGRLVEVAGLPSPAPAPPLQPRAVSTGAMQSLAQESALDDPQAVEGQTAHRPAIQWQWIVNKLFLLVEIAAVTGLVAILFNLWRTSAELNQELAQIQRAESLSLALPTPTPTPIIDVVILPGGHKPPVAGVPSEPGEAGNIPAHLLPAINAYVPPPIPTPSLEQARRIQIQAIDVDSPIVQGMYDWEQLKKGVAQHIGSASPGQVGNMVLAGHNDIYGEVFRHLDKLSPGDEIVVSTQRQNYTYVVRQTKIVEPTDVSVIDPTEYASTTLISCYPYRINTQRIIVFADLVENT